MRQRRGLFDLRGYNSGNSKPLTRISHITGPIPFLNPTRARLQNASTDEYSHLETSYSSEAFSRRRKLSRRIAYQWTGRNNRKGRHLLLISPSRSVFAKSIDKQYVFRKWAVVVGILRMLTHFPLWDISYLLAMIFCIGSAAWVLDGLLLLAPYRGQDYIFNGAGAYTSGLTAFLGTGVFVLSNTILMFEAINAFSGHCAGWTVNQTLDATNGFNTYIKPGRCQHRHELARQSLLARTLHFPFPGFIPRQVKNHAIGQDIPKRLVTGQRFVEQYPSFQWRWMPTYHELRCHYLYDIGFLAGAIQFISSLLFYVGSVTRLVGFYWPVSPALSIAFLWVPKFLGSVGFIIAALLVLVETQTHWLRPAPTVLGWHVGGWSLLGGIAFLLSSCLGVITWSSWAQYQSAIATLWGGVAFFNAGLLQWFESLQKYTIEVEDLNEGDGGHEC